MSAARHPHSTCVITPEIIQDRHREADPELGQLSDFSIAKLNDGRKQAFRRTVSIQNSRQAIKKPDDVSRVGVLAAIDNRVSGSLITEPHNVRDVIAHSDERRYPVEQMRLQLQRLHGGAQRAIRPEQDTPKD
ncbi:hypothetical protein [Paraburkholderia sediminicola]|uniref:hypothetical protein n=1 Tax=Paraburkholderia sediminicola TaxID=458836 RepID=UPI0038BB1283